LSRRPGDDQTRGEDVVTLDRRRGLRARRRPLDEDLALEVELADPGRRVADRDAVDRQRVFFRAQDGARGPLSEG
jgi:hypothetical protein